MALIECEEHLHENLPDDILRDEVFLSSTLFNQLRHIAIFTILHHYQELVLLFQNDLVIVLDDIEVI